MDPGRGMASRRFPQRRPVDPIDGATYVYYVPSLPMCAYKHTCMLLLHRQRCGRTALHSWGPALIT